MRAAILVVACLLLACATAVQKRKIVCYFGSWAIYRPGNGHFDTTNIDPKLCTHLIYAFVGLKDDFTVENLDPVADLPGPGNKDGFNKFVGLRVQNPSAKFMVSLGGWGQGSVPYSKLVSDPKNRKTLVESAVTFLKKYKFDGLDFDWEYPNQRGGVESDKQNFVLMLKELRERFDKENLLLTAAVGAAQPSASLSYIIPKVSKYLHFINLMTYDFHGIWDKKTGMNAPLYAGTWEKGEDKLLNSFESVKYWISQGAPAEKIIMGIPFYGKTFTLDDPKNKGIGAPASAPGVAGPYTSEAGILGYNEICEMQMKEKWETYFQSSQQVPYAVKGNQWISYDSPWSILKKAQFIDRAKLGGAMIWSIETDDFRGICGIKYRLLKVINSILNKEDASVLQ